MPTVKVNQPHTLGKDGAMARMGRFEEVLTTAARRAAATATWACAPPGRSLDHLIS
ncbi:MAG: hypothetical protein FJ100_23295 [Deltaproteobacteria bacterium]|nr:hypothetical protein [Deltaproteobacteria bacterium]